MTERPDRPRLGRKGNRKVRTGCITCKIRKVKCDETKPFCMRCQSSGRVCDGYAPVPPRARRTVPIIQLAEDSHLSSDDNSEGTLVALSPTARSPTVVAVSPSLSILQPTDDSSGILQRFHKRTAPRLAGFMDSFFWHELVLQLGDVEPAVLHALSAVNSIYEYCEDTGTLTNQPVQKRLMHPAYSHGLKQYNKAIGELVRHSESPTSGDESVHLVCCVLFVCVEMLAKERMAAMAHFDQGLQVLAGYAVGNEEKPGPLLKADMVRETLVPIFRRLSIQAILFGREPPLLPIFTHMFNDESLRSNAPFRTMDEANDALVVILDHGLRAVNEIVGLNSQKHGVKYDPERWMLMFETIKIGRDAILGELNMWIDNFSPLAAITVATPGADPKAKLGCNTLKIQHLIAEIWVSCILETAETAFDSQLTNFATVVHLASDILYMERGFGEETQSPVFVFEMGVLACVFFTACRCRQRRIRRAALLLLQEWPRRENLWDPASMSRVAKRMIEIEDKDALDPEAPDDVWPPEWKRIHKMDAEDEVDEDGNAVMACIFHRKPCGLDGEWEVIREAI